MSTEQSRQELLQGNRGIGHMDTWAAFDEQFVGRLRESEQVAKNIGPHGQ